jgi:hypothetical protein
VFREDGQSFLLDKPPFFLPPFLQNPYEDNFKWFNFWWFLYSSFPVYFSPNISDITFAL